MTEPTEPTLLDVRAALAGAYEIEAPLGRGGMSFVYLARERRLDRRVAIKVLSPELAVDDAYRRLFLHEARTVAALTHPNIVPIHAVGEVGDFVFFAMAYVEGDTLAQRIATVGPLKPHRAARLLCDIGEALGFAHARGVVHRDVKPDNILIDAATGRALLSDFGIAHASPPSRSPGLLGRPAAPRGLVVGTAPFMSPEQASGDLVDARSDIYSLGVVAYYALSGRLPFQANTDEGFLARSTHLEAPALIHAFVTGVGLLPVTVAAWLSPASAAVRAVATVVLGVALMLPVVVAVVRVRRLLADGHGRDELVAALAARQARRREELAFVYGNGPTSFERWIGWLARMALLAVVAGVAATLELIEVPALIVPFVPSIVTAGAATAVLAAILARARTEKRTDLVGERSLRFWRGPLGRALFRFAQPRREPVRSVVTVLDRLETPA